MYDLPPTWRSQQRTKTREQRCWIPTKRELLLLTHRSWWCHLQQLETLSYAGRSREGELTQSVSRGAGFGDARSCFLGDVVLLVTALASIVCDATSGVGNGRCQAGEGAGWNGRNDAGDIILRGSECNQRGEGGDLELHVGGGDLITEELDDGFGVHWAGRGTKCQEAGEGQGKEGEPRLFINNNWERTPPGCTALVSLHMSHCTEGAPSGKKSQISFEILI
jgi:hypothetical protein